MSLSFTRFKKKKNQPEGEPIPTPSHYTIELQDPERTTSSDEVDEITSNGFVLNASENGNGKCHFDPSTHRMMKSIEHNCTADQDIYRRFKDRHSSKDSHTSGGDDSTHLPKPEPLRPDSTNSSHETSLNESLDGPMEFFTESDISAILRPDLDSTYLRSVYFNTPEKDATPPRAEPPSTLDVLPVRSKKLLQTSMISSTSGDESIGDCSLDANLTGQFYFT